MGDAPQIRDCVVIGAGQAGLSTAYHLRRIGIDYIVLDANAGPGGAWQHRWPSLTMDRVHGVAALPGMDVPDSVNDEPARAFVPAYFAAYERSNGIDVKRPVTVRRVDDDDGVLQIRSDDGVWPART